MDDIGNDFESPAAIAEMRRRHLKIALELQELGARGLAEVRKRGELTAEECKQLLEAGIRLESAAGTGGSRRRH